MEDFEESWSPSSFSSSCNAERFPSSLQPVSSNPQPLAIDAELWLLAEQRTQEILWVIQPALVSDRSRNEIIDYVHRLIRDYYGVEVFSFGSVPLKTYLPDGDIDLTVLSHQTVEEDLAVDLCSILQAEENGSEFEIVDVNYVRAQVKLLKCTIRNVAVDISFNQMAGICALSFLEEVDQLIGKDHLFKRSIILIKAWCYYESRILGAHHGLIATYALEALVLYIINHFHSTLCGPLAVLYRFLDYYSTFDWEHYCVSISGPVSISSLPEIKAENSGGDDLLLSQEFLSHCRGMHSVHIGTSETGNDFPVKHLNIVDPLKDNNNLGRSVSKGNFNRIRCALTFGIQRLRQILMLPSENMGMKLEMFFMNTLSRNGKGQRSDVQVPVPAFGTGRSEASDLNGYKDVYCNSLTHDQWFHGYASSARTQTGLPVRSALRSSSQNQNNNSSWDMMCQVVHPDQSEHYRRGRELNLPRLSYCDPYTSQLLSGPYLQFDEKRKSRGTGTYIPTMSPHIYRERERQQGARSLESRRHRPMVESPKSTEKDYSLDNTDDGGNNFCFDLTLEEFPQLSEIKNPTASEINQPSQPEMKNPQVKNCAFPIEGSIKFGSYECSTSSLPKSQANSVFSRNLGRGSSEET